MNMTLTLRVVLHTLATRHPGRVYGLEIVKATGLKGGTVYPLLNRLVEELWCTAVWEEPEIAMTGQRPRRCYFALTELGLAHARDAMIMTVGGRRYRLVADDT